jgi:hypothetical protein
MANTNEMGIGKLATALLIKGGRSRKEVLETVLKVFPTAQTTMKGIAYYAKQAGITSRVKVEADADELAKVLAELNGETPEETDTPEELATSPAGEPAVVEPEAPVIEAESKTVVKRLTKAERKAQRVEVLKSAAV